MSGEKTFFVDICGYEYEISNRISFGDLKKIQGALQNDDADFQKVMACLIYRKIIIDNKPTLEEIYSDANLKICAEKFVLISSDLEERYKSNCERMEFYRAILTTLYEQYDLELKEVIVGLPKMNNEVLQGVASTINAFSQNIVKIVSLPVWENVARITTRISEVLGNIALSVGEMIQNIHIPSLSEEEKEGLILAYRAWGSYGWTMMPESFLFEFVDCPVDIKEANKLALNECKNSNMEHLFDTLRSMKGIKKSDLEEAIFDFKHKQYKSCALIIFGLIDAKLIRLQPKDKNPNGERRKVGQGAVKRVLEHIKKEKNIEKKFFTLLEYENVFACMNTVFANAEDFRSQPIVINRNFVDHGMMTRQAIRKDCVQLFLLYYNLLKFLDLVS